MAILKPAWSRPLDRLRHNGYIVMKILPTRVVKVRVAEGDTELSVSGTEILMSLGLQACATFSLSRGITQSCSWACDSVWMIWHLMLVNLQESIFTQYVK